MLWPGTELTRSDQFTDVRQSTIDRRAIISAQDYIGHLSTISAYLELSSAVREVVFDRIRNVLPDHVTLVAGLVLHLDRLG
jgi:hypothetical protein